MKILILSRYDRLGASSRMRIFQYLPWLELAGFETTCVPLFSDAYVASVQLSKRSAWEVIKALTHRVLVVINGKKFDLLWIEKEVLPWLPVWVEKLLLSRGVPYVLDYDDAVFHQYDKNRNSLLKALLRGKHPQLMRGAALVVAGNEYLSEYAKNAGAPHVELVPTVVDLVRYPAPTPKQEKVILPCVGWIGQRATAQFLAPHVALFERLSSEGTARFEAVGIDTAKLGLPMDSIPWSEQTEVDSIAAFDVGIMPLLDGPFERGKCGYKLIQYMACGLPVVASPVGVNRQLVDHGVNGFLAETPEQWEHALRTLLIDPNLRRHMGKAGREKVELKYSLQVTAPMLSGMLVEAVKRNIA